jgi:glycerol kinase
MQLFCQASAADRTGKVVRALEASEGQQRFVRKPTGLLRDHIFARFKVHISDHRTRAIEATSVATALLRTGSNALMWQGADRDCSTASTSHASTAYIA